jgi:hypothetical protein
VLEDSGYCVRVYENRDDIDEFGWLMREFELYGGEHQACVRITFNNLTKEVLLEVIISCLRICVRVL